MRKSLPALVVALVAALLAVPAVYAALRAYDAVSVAAPSSVVSASSEHIAMFWRLLVSLYAAGFVGIVAFVATRDIARAARILSALVVVVAAVIGAQGLLLP